MLAFDARLHNATKDEDFPATAAGAVSIPRWQVTAHIHSLPCYLDTWHLGGVKLVSDSLQQMQQV